MNKKAEFLGINKDQENRIELIRNSFSNMYDVIDINYKQNREILLGIERLEEAQYWLIKGISREE